LQPDRPPTGIARATPQHSLGVAGPVLLVTAAALATTALVVNEQARRAERAHPPIGRFLTVAGTRLHYTDSGGSGPALVLLHGNGSMIQEMQISGLVDAASPHYRVITFDRPGYGYSERPRDRDWTPEAQAHLFRRAFVALGLDRPIVFGHSWGTLVAVALGLDHPEAVRGLVLASGYYFPTARLDVPMFGAAAIPVIGDVMRHTVSPLLGRAIAPLMFRKIFAPREPTPQFMAEFPLDLALRPSQIRAAAEESAFMIPAAARFESRYGQLRVPVFIVTGAEDHYADPDRQSARLYGAIPHSELRVLPGLGHMAHHFAAGEMVKAVDAVAAAAGADTRASVRRDDVRREIRQPA
jgi:pimeloyl-ACP methyl ester carboxylesterase